MRDKVWVCDDEPSERFPVYTRGNVGEVFSDAVSPLTWSAYGPQSWELGWRDAFCEMGVFTPQEFKPEGVCELIGCFGGYVYINMSVTRVLALRIPGLTVEAIDKSLFGDYPDVPAYRPDPRDQNAERTRHAAVWLSSLFSSDAKVATDKEWTCIQSAIATRPDLIAMSESDLLKHFRYFRAANRQAFKRHVLNTYGGNVLASMITQIAQAAGASDLAAKVTAAIGDVDSAKLSYELWELSRQVRGAPKVHGAFDEGVDGLLDRLRGASDPLSTRFLAQWSEFIARWGFLGPNVWELRSPTYRTHPEIALRMLERLRQAPNASSPHAGTATLAAEREAAIADIAQRLTGSADVQGQFLAAARCCGSYLAARERSKQHCALVLDAARAPLRELGQRLVRRGVLARWEQVLLVTDEEADAFVANPASYGALIAERAARLEMLSSKEPPFVFEGEPPPLSAFGDRGRGDTESAPAGAELRGIGVSPGRYKGRARIITSLATDSELEPGEVIVAVTTDAAWGPLFLAAGAVVVETGAPISHAAIVARELGIPAVVSVTSATQRIREGSMITVDGNSGTVLVD